MTKKLIDLSKTYRTRHGLVVSNVRGRSVAGTNDDYPIQADISNTGDAGWSYKATYTCFGEFWVGETNDLDLIEVEISEPPAQPTTSVIRDGVTYHTRDGRPVRVLCTDALGAYLVAALVRNPAFLSFQEAEHMFMYSKCGQEIAYCGDMDDEYYSSLALVEVGKAVAA